MEKSKDTKYFATHAVFVIAVLLGLFFIVTSDGGITGYQVLDAGTAKAKLESALSSAAAFSSVNQASICVVIRDPEQPLSLQAEKTSAGWSVSEMKEYCTGFAGEDIIIQFSDYDSFSKVMDNPSPRAVAMAAISQDYQILKSKYVELGGNVVCDAAFRIKYCAALNQMATPEQLIEGDMSCCIEKLTKSQKKLLEEHLQDSRFKDEVGVLETPTATSGMSMTTSIIGLAVIILIIVGIVVGVMMKGGKKAAKSTKSSGSGTAMSSVTTPGTPVAASQTPGIVTSSMGAQPASSPVGELRRYVVDVLLQGYDPADIRNHLIEMGWDAQTTDSIIQEAYSLAQSQQNN